MTSLSLYISVIDNIAVCLSTFNEVHVVSIEHLEQLRRQDTKRKNQASGVTKYPQESRCRQDGVRDTLSELKRLW